MGNKTNAAQPVEEEDIEKMWVTGAIGLSNPRALLNLVWWNNMTQLSMRGFQEHDCGLEDFIVTREYIEYTERQTKNRQGDEESSRKRAQKCNNKIFPTDGGDRNPYRAFLKYINHRPKGENVPPNFSLTPVVNPKGETWYKLSAVDKNRRKWNGCRTLQQALS